MKKFHYTYDVRRFFKNLGIDLAILGAASILCAFLESIDGSSDKYSPLIFVLAVVFISKFTGNYLHGALSSFLSTLAVNYAFTYPYFAFNFSIAGYPITFLTFTIVSITVGMMTTQIKTQEKMQLEIEKEKLYNNLLRSVSHDIRTPLTSIVGAASAYLENTELLSEAKKTDLITDVRDEAQELIRVVENLLSITRLNGGQMTIHKDIEAAEEIISAAVTKFKKRFPDIETHITVPKEIILVPMDAILIEQVLMNIMDNAVYHGESTTAIYISLSSEPKKAIFRISDNGNGIAPDILPNIFNSYSTSARKPADTRKNFGIGLSVCFSIIRAHGGVLSAGNNKKGGAWFEFSLPLESEEKGNDN